jgi:hypothetical protein
MESRFNKNTYPHLFHNPSHGSEYHQVYEGILTGNENVSPVRDIRYPAYAGPMSDARVVTDYRPQCSKNIRPAYQFHTKRWLIEHATDVMEESRRRQIEGSGASLPMANTVPPPAMRVYSTPFESNGIPTYLHHGIGVERLNASAPDLFGTFSYEPTMAEIRHNRKNIGMTRFQEGGRNSTRGVF